MCVFKKFGRTEKTFPRQRGAGWIFHRIDHAIEDVAMRCLCELNWLLFWLCGKEVPIAQSGQGLLLSVLLKVPLPSRSNKMHLELCFVSTSGKSPLSMIISYPGQTCYKRIRFKASFFFGGLNPAKSQPTIYRIRGLILLFHSALLLAEAQDEATAVSTRVFECEKVHSGPTLFCAHF